MSREPAVVVVAVAAAAGVVLANPGLAEQLRTRVADVPVLGGLVSAAAAAVGNGPGKHKREGKGEGEATKARATDGIPARYRILYKRAAAGSSCGVSWRVLAGIGYVESRHGANPGPSRAGALGPMQFMPATWRDYGRDGNRDGRKDINDPADAIPAAAAYLCASGAGRNVRGALWHYNHSQRYVDQVMSVADRLD